MTQTNPAPPNFSGQYEWISPTFLLGYFGSRYTFAMSILYDAVGDATSYAVRARFPATAPDDALPVLSSDRQIDRGPAEGRASFEARLVAWLDLWRVAGGAPAVLRAMGTVLLPSATTIETVNDTTEDNLTAWDVSVNAADPPTHYLESPGNWDWDSLRVPGRAWVIFFNGPWAQTPTWGGGQTWGDGWCYGWDAPETTARFIRSQVAKWKAAGCSVPFIIIAFNASWFQPTLPPGDPLLPDGTWGNWSKVVVQGGRRVRVQARTDTAIYITGVP